LTGENFRLQGRFQKLEAGPRRIIAGYANMAIVDHEGDLITVEAWEKASARFMASGFQNVNLQHQNITVGRLIPEYKDENGKLWNTHVDDNGWFVVAEIRNDLMVADLAWDLVEKKVLKEFSISGTAYPGETEIVCPMGQECHRKINDLEMYEVTLCESGVNPGSAFAILKSEGCCDLCKDTLRFVKAGPDSKELADVKTASQSRLNRHDTQVENPNSLENHTQGEKKMTKEIPKPATEEKKAETPPPTPPPTAPPLKQDAPPASPDMAAVVAKLDQLMGLVQKLVDEETAEDGNETEEPGEGMMTQAVKGEGNEAPPPPGILGELKAETPGTQPSVAELVAQEVRKQIDGLVKTGPTQKRSKVPDAGTPAGPTDIPVIELVKKAHDEAGWTGVEALAEQVLRKAQGSQ
jgi:hypothetical protein